MQEGYGINGIGVPILLAPIQYQIRKRSFFGRIVYFFRQIINAGSQFGSGTGTGKSAYSIAKWKNDMAQAQYRTDAYN